MDDKFGPKVTSIFRAETSAKRYTWDKKSIKHMHLRFSFFRIGIVHACKHINELYACQVSDGYVVKQASSSGSNFSRF